MNEWQHTITVWSVRNASPPFCSSAKATSLSPGFCSKGLASGSWLLLGISKCVFAYLPLGIQHFVTLRDYLTLF